MKEKMELEIHILAYEFFFFSVLFFTQDLIISNNIIPFVTVLVALLLGIELSQDIQCINSNGLGGGGGCQLSRGVIHCFVHCSYSSLPT